MTMKGLEAYKMPDAEEITLPNSNVSFLVELPTQWNRPYQRQWQEQVSQHGKMEDGEYTVSGLSAIEFAETQMKAFIENCIKRMPDWLTVEMLLGEYYPAASTLFKIATKRAEEVEERAKAQTGK